MGPHPYPWMVRELQRVIGDEAREQCRALLGGATPTSSSRASAAAPTPPACSPGSSTPTPRLVGVEPAGGAAVGHGVPGVVHGSKSYLLQDEHGQVLEAHSISAGLDYPGVGPEHAHLAAIGRARTRRPPTARSSTPSRCLPAPRASSRRSSRPTRSRGSCGPRDGAGRQGRTCSYLSGRGDKDADQVTDILGGEVRRCPRGAPAGRRDAGRKLLVPYVTGGLGEDWPEVVRAFAAAGADAIEIGIPFSDPVMDGPTSRRRRRRRSRRARPRSAILDALAAGGRRGADRRHDLRQPGVPHRATGASLRRRPPRG